MKDSKAKKEHEIRHRKEHNEQKQRKDSKGNTTKKQTQRKSSNIKKARLREQSPRYKVNKHTRTNIEERTQRREEHK